MAKELTLSVFRYDPASDRMPQFRQYKVESGARLTVLDALRKIKEERDGTLALRYSCRSAICGSCAMRINGNSKLACNTMADTEVERHGKLVVEPMANLSVVKDLVVEMGPFWKHLVAQKPWLIPDEKKEMPARENMMTQEQNERFEGTPNCILCGACHSACPAVEVDESFPGPAALAKLYRFVVDPRDGSSRVRLESTTDMGLWWCVRCYLCVDACPKDVRPGEMITKLRELATEETGAREPGSRHVKAFLKNIEKYGNLNEFALAKDTLGIPGMLKQALDPGLGLRMIDRGKAPPLSQAPIKKIDQVSKIYEEYGQER